MPVTVYLHYTHGEKYNRFLHVFINKETVQVFDLYLFVSQATKFESSLQIYKKIEIEELMVSQKFGNVHRFLQHLSCYDIPLEQWWATKQGQWVIRGGAREKARGPLILKGGSRLKFFYSAIYSDCCTVTQQNSPCKCIQQYGTQLICLMLTNDDLPSTIHVSIEERISL